MSRVLGEIVDAGGPERKRDAAHVREHYIAHPDRVACSVAVDEGGAILGFQSLKRASVGNPYGVAVGWGIIGTHVSPKAARRGVGAALFAVSREAAVAAGLVAVDASIGAGNAVALGFYEALGFRTYRETGRSVQKMFEVG